MKRIRLRLTAIWYILTKRNFVLVNGSHYDKDGTRMVKIQCTYRTDFTREDDVYFMKGAYYYTLEGFPGPGILERSGEMNGERYDRTKFTAPFRVGKKQQRAVLDKNGLCVTLFNPGQELQAQLYCDYLNGH